MSFCPHVLNASTKEYKASYMSAIKKEGANIYFIIHIDVME
jgi:hypothetical protein